MVRLKEQMFGKIIEACYNICNRGGNVRPSELFTKITKQTGLFNIQAIDNISSIMQRGLLSNGMALHKYANVYFDPRNPMLYKRRDENDNICILKFDRSILDFEGVVVSDRNALSAYAGFYPPEVGLNEIDFRLVFSTDWQDENIYMSIIRRNR